MARNARLPRPRSRPRRERAQSAALAPVTGGTLAEAPPVDPAPDDARTVHGWLVRVTDEPAVVERLLAEVLGRARAGVPACVRTASRGTRLQYLTIESVLRLRGVL